MNPTLSPKQLTTGQRTLHLHFSEEFGMMLLLHVNSTVSVVLQRLTQVVLGHGSFSTTAELPHGKGSGSPRDE